MTAEPEVYHIKPTKHVPNNKLPVVVYRKAYTGPLDEYNITEFLERNHWVKGGSWTAFTKPHCHPNCHECYGIFSGETTLVLGRGPYDTEEDGMLLHVEQGDIFILPAGVSHCSTKLDKNYKFIGVYPENGPKYQMNFCRDPKQVERMIELCDSVELPVSDPAFGDDGPLTKLWGTPQ